MKSPPVGWTNSAGFPQPAPGALICPDQWHSVRKYAQLRPLRAVLCAGCVPDPKWRPEPVASEKRRFLGTRHDPGTSQRLLRGTCRQGAAPRASAQRPRLAFAFSRNISPGRM